MCIHIGTPTGAEDQGRHQLEVSEFECANCEPNQGKPRSITLLVKFSVFISIKSMYCNVHLRSGVDRNLAALNPYSHGFV